jgi:polyvinyl alcohol dehydrogenase (cytochrome)
LVILSLLATTVLAAGGAGWPMGGYDRQNTRYQKTESKISPANVGDLAVKWQTDTGGNVSATPAVADGALYYPDWAGNLNAVDRKTGELIWQRQIAEYTGVAGDFARATPAIYNDFLIFGDQGGQLGAGARVMAVDRYTGDPVWVTQVEDHLAAIVTQSATVHGDRVYVGVASYEEGLAGFIPGYPCCSFRGSMLALDASTGAIMWQTYTAPEGYSGSAVWGSSPVVDTKRNSLYIATGNNYSIPDEVSQCIIDAGDNAEAQQACLAADNYFDAVVALDLKTGAVKWATSVIPFDTWNGACLTFLPVYPDNCPNLEGPDFDFGQAPMLYTTKVDNKNRDFLGVGQKSGIFWSLDPDTGQIVWSTQVSPGGVAGGMIWGSATDGTALYTSSANSELKPWTLVDGSSTNSGIWSALDPATGEILWQTAAPAAFASAGGAVTVANGLVYACAQNFVGENMFAMNAATGDVLWSFASGGACNSGAAVVDGTVYWGFGYFSLIGAPTGGHGMIAFEIPK